MSENNKLIRVFSGTEIPINLLKNELEQGGISAIIQNDFQSGIMAGFSGGGPSAIDLFILESDLEGAIPIIEGFKLREEM
jgi:hypothetical protein